MKKTWQKVLSALGMAIAAGVLVWLFWYVRETVDLGKTLRALRLGWLVAAVLAMPAMEVSDALIYYAMGRMRGEPVGLSGALATTFIGELYYRLGPAGAPVQLGLMVESGYTPTCAASAYTWKCISNTMVYGGYTAAALLCKLVLFKEDMGWTLVPSAVLLGSYILLCAAVFWVAARPEQCAGLAERLVRFGERHMAWLRKHDRADRACEKVRTFCGDLRAIRENKPLFGGMIFGMWVELSCFFAIPAFLYKALGLSGGAFWDVMLTTCLVLVLARLIVLPGNAGGAEGSFFLFMSPLFGEQVSVALVLWRLITFALPMAMGAVWALCRTALRGRRKGNGLS